MTYAPTTGTRSAGRLHVTATHATPKASPHAIVSAVASLKLSVIRPPATHTPATKRTATTGAASQRAGLRRFGETVMAIGHWGRVRRYSLRILFER